MWVKDREEWLEARCTSPGLLADLPVPWETPPPDATLREGIFSLVVEDDTGRTRQLPSLYHGNAHIFAHRDVDEVRARLVRTVQAVLEADARPSYLVTACRLGDRFGLYARDIFNRDAFRLRAARAGLVLAEEPYVAMTEDGSFTCEGWEPFRPDFIVVKSLRSAGGDANLNRGAFLTFMFGILRVGDMGAVELHHLVKTIKTAEIVADDDPAHLVETLRAGETVS
jgi:hypothetical protein